VQVARTVYSQYIGAAEQAATREGDRSFIGESASTSNAWHSKIGSGQMTESTEDKVDKLYQDMYFGEGRDNPSMTTRMSNTGAEN
jgi:hypothetical protein